MAGNPEALAEIRANIIKHGHHIYAVSGSALPRYVYTIGNLDRLGAELILAGGANYSLDEVIQAVDEIALEGRRTGSAAVSTTASLGRIDLRPVNSTWIHELMLGATDYFGPRPVSALQLVPDSAHSMIDTPDMTLPISPVAAPAWRWLSEPWPYPIAEDSVAITNVGALRGEPVTEAARWEESEWELFAGAGPNVQREDIRAVPLGTLLGVDPSLQPVTALPVGKALWREDRGAPWHKWGE